jgi:hypothetical protein
MAKHKGKGKMFNFDKSVDAGAEGEKGEKKSKRHHKGMKKSRRGSRR